MFTAALNTMAKTSQHVAAPRPPDADIHLMKYLQATYEGRNAEQNTATLIQFPLAQTSLIPGFHRLSPPQWCCTERFERKAAIQRHSDKCYCTGYCFVRQNQTKVFVRLWTEGRNRRPMLQARKQSDVLLGSL